MKKIDKYIKYIYNTRAQAIKCNLSPNTKKDIYKTGLKNINFQLILLWLGGLILNFICHLAVISTS